MVARQRRLLVHAGDGLHQRPGEPVALGGAPVHCRRKGAGDAAVLVRLGEPPGCGGVAPACAAVGGPMAQHEMGKVDVPLVRRRVRAHGHEAHVAERAGVHDRLEARGLDRIQLARFGFVNQVEQARKGVAEAEAAPATVADVEDAARLPLQRLAVVEIGVSPVYGMAEGRALVGHRDGCVTGTNRRAGYPAPRCRMSGRNAGSAAGSLAPPGDQAPRVRRRAKSSPVRDPHSWRLHAAHPI